MQLGLLFRIVALLKAMRLTFTTPTSNNIFLMSTGDLSNLLHEIGILANFYLILKNITQFNK